jgi:hypothetical protein
MHMCFSHVNQDTSKSFPRRWLGLALLLAKTLLYIHSPKTQALLNHTDTHYELRQHTPGGKIMACSKIMACGTPMQFQYT